MKRTNPEAGLWSGFDILVVSPTPTHPQDHGNRKRIFEVCKELKRQGARIHLVHYASEHDWRNSRPSRWEHEMVAAWDSYQLVAPSRPLHELSSGLDHLIDEWSDPALSSYLRWAFKVQTYDVVLVEYTWMSFCFNAVPKDVFKICDTHDVFGGRRQLLARNGILPEFFYTTPEEEKKGLERADLIWAIKESERSYFKATLGLKDCLTLLYAEPARDWWVHRPSPDGWLRVGIIGAKNNVNRQNLEAFISIALPMFESYMAPVKLVIAGGCSDDFTNLRHPNLEVLGRVPEVADFYRSMDVICAPMQFSTGLKIKVAEALGSGAPLVAHAHAMEGYPATHPLHALPDFRSIGLELVKLAFDPSEIPALAANSVVTTKKIQALVTQTLEETRQRIVAARADGIVVVASLHALDKHSLLHDHLYSTLNYLRFGAPITLYIVGPAFKFNADLLSDFGFAVGVLIAPKLAESLGDSLPESWKPLDFASLLRNRGIKRGYFLAPDPQLDSIWPGALHRAFVRYDAVALLGEDPRVLIEALKLITSVVVISATAISIADEGIATVCQAPFRRKNVYASLAHRVSVSGRWAGLLILAEVEDLLVRMLRELATDMCVPAAVLNVSDASAVRDLVFTNNGCDPRVNVAGARLIVDLGTTSAVSGVILEGARRAGVPVVHLARGTSAVALQQVQHVARPVTIEGLFRTVATGLVEGAVRRRLIEAAQTEAAGLSMNDAGWAWIWRDLTKETTVPNALTATNMLFAHDDLGTIKAST